VFAPTPSSSGALLLTAAEDGSARLWTIGSPTAAAELRGARGATDAAVFSPDGQHVLTGGDTRTAVIWDLTDKPRVARTLQDHRDAVFGVAYSSSGGLAATASADGTARIWEPASGRTLQVLQGHAGWVNAVAFSPDDRLVATASQDATARLWDANTGRFMRELRGHTGEVTGVGFSPDGRLLVTASRDGTARIWEVASGKFLSVISGLTGEVNSAAFSPDGGRIVIAGKDGIAQIHRCEDCDSTQQLLDLTRTRLTRALTPHEEDVYLHARGT